MQAICSATLRKRLMRLVSLPIKRRRLEKRPDRTDVRDQDYRSMVQ